MHQKSYCAQPYITFTAGGTIRVVDVTGFYCPLL